MLQALIEHYHTKYPNKDWHFFDVHQMFENILANPMIYGISNVTDTCFEEDFKANISLRPVVRLEYRFVPEPKKACEQYLFFDPVHPTNKAHRIMSEQVLENLSDVLDSQSVS